MIIRDVDIIIHFYVIVINEVLIAQHVIHFMRQVRYFNYVHILKIIVEVILYAQLMFIFIHVVN